MNSGKKILVISESIDVEDSSASKGRVALIYNLKKVGYTVKVLHYTRKEIQLKEIECININELKFSVNYVLSRTQRVLQRLLKLNFSRFLENIFGHSFAFFNDSKSISRAIKHQYNNEDLIITLSKGASFRPHHAMLRLPKLHDKWMAYVHDPYPFHYYPRPYNWVEKGYKYKEDFFRQVSEKAKYSAFPSLLLKEWMGSYFSNFLKTGLVIPHQNLDNNFSEETSLPIYVDQEKFNLLHAGNLMKQRDPRGLIEGFRLFLENNTKAKSDAQLILLGNADYHKNYLIQILDDNIYWSNGNVPFKEVDKVQNNVTINIILESKSEISPFLPGKFPHIINANKPVLLLGPNYSESKRLLGKDYYYTTEVDDIELIAKLIEDFYNKWKNETLHSLDREDLILYCGKSYLNKVIDKIGC